MRSFVAKIGLFDKNGIEHSIELEPGVNIITGRSSTGKSALIEIFDFCLGSSEDTIPDGIITDYADIYFTIISIKGSYLVLARNPEQPTKVFLKYDSEFNSDLSITSDYFESDYFHQINDFKSTLSNFLGIDISDTDEDLEEKKQKKKSKGRPSARHMTSYFFQHQNLIANKHSLFYRFDEKEKREQTIDQFKIFCGFVDQNYYIKKQELNELELELERIRKQESSNNDYKKNLTKKLQDNLEEYGYTVGKPLFDVFAPQIISSPKHYLDLISKYAIKVDDESDEYLKRLKTLNVKKNILIANRREKHIRFNQIQSTINYAKKYSTTLDDIKPLEDIRKSDSICPFCHSNNHSLEFETNKLTDAINWLNQELRKTPLLLDSLQPEKRKIEKEINALNEELSTINKHINEVLRINSELKKNRSLEEQGLKIVLQIENILDEVLEINTSDIYEKIKSIEKKIAIIQKELEKNYNYKSKLNKAQDYINKQMNIIGAKLDFEQTYQPINLNFDIETFELYHQKKDKKRVYLRSMGSGANWLNSHICLFTSLLRYFCTLENKCKIPSFLFLDQPSQVYFPTIIDNKTEFDPKTLKELENEGKKLDEDLRAVTNLFDQLVELCDSIEKEVGFKPQIIITDHADNLSLKNANFEDLVNGRRWRNKNSGLVTINEDNKESNE